MPIRKHLGMRKTKRHLLVTRRLIGCSDSEKWDINIDADEIDWRRNDLHFCIGELWCVLSGILQVLFIVTALQHGTKKVRVERAGRSSSCLYMFWRVNDRDSVR